MVKKDKGRSLLKRADMNRLEQNRYLALHLLFICSFSGYAI